MHYDVVIIGAGPSGIAAGHNIINNNISCCIIDKQKFPRNKLCAGGVTQKTFELLKSLNIDVKYFIDRDPEKWDSKLVGSEIIGPQDTRINECPFILIAARHAIVPVMQIFCKRFPYFVINFGEYAQKVGAYYP